MAGQGTRAVARRATPRGAGGPVITTPARDSAEHVVVRLRRSARVLLGPALVFVVVCGATGYWWGRLSPPWLNSALPIVAAVVVVALCLVPVLLWLNRVTIITTRRLIVQRGFLVRERRELLLVRSSEATLRRGPLQLLAGSGDVIVHADSQGRMVLHDVPRARLVHRAVADLIEHAAAPPGALARRASG